MTNVLILAANEPHDDRDSGYPLCLTEVEGKPLLQHLTEQCESIDDLNLILAVRDEDCKRWHLDNVVKLLSPRAHLLRVQRRTGGAACTALLAIESINNDEPLLILNGNELVAADFRTIIEKFKDARYDAGVMVFPSVHPRYSYVRINDKDLVVECAEKNPISNHATVGFYWFRQGQDFITAAQQTILKHAHVDGLYYICPTLNELVLKQRRIGVHRISATDFHPFKSERQMDRLEAAIELNRKRL